MLLHHVLITYIVAAAPNLERVVLLVTISLKGRGYNSSAGLSRLRELLQWIRYYKLYGNWTFFGFQPTVTHQLGDAANCDALLSVNKINARV